MPGTVDHHGALSRSLQPRMNPLPESFALHDSASTAERDSISVRLVQQALLPLPTPAGRLRNCSSRLACRRRVWPSRTDA